MLGDYRLINICFFYIFFWVLIYSFFYEYVPEVFLIPSTYQEVDVGSTGLTRAFNQALNGRPEIAISFNSNYLPALIWLCGQFAFRGLTLLIIKIDLVINHYVWADITASLLSFILCFYKFLIY